MRRAQRIVALEGEVVLRAIELSELVEADGLFDGDVAALVLYERASAALGRLDDKVRELRQELERLGEPPAAVEHSLRVGS